MFPKPNQNHKLPGSYRSISLLSNIAKLYEKILLKRLNDYYNKNNIIPNEQFGFRTSHSCTQQLLRVANKIVDGFKAKLFTGAQIARKFAASRAGQNKTGPGAKLICGALKLIS
ncbi:hypothetical protein AVEN_75422-1 [Araneus ventricosus]|uniref:Reverse transcriptase domain-containing protein n=1 Tax=Araneus ventricosus TaxID=182803 RepID=A0A4Y2ECA2_ARAVE|nr:hypothetical protein AVEN_75422-1 [Araneus ventricosus]